MTGYLLLALSLIAGATKGFCGKKISTYTNDLFSALKANLLRMLICVVLEIVQIMMTYGISMLMNIKGFVLNMTVLV